MKNPRLNKKYVIEDDSDKTPDITRALDHYLLDNDITMLVKELYDEPVRGWSNWYYMYSDVVNLYFSKPYSTSHIEIFGLVESE